MDFDVRSYVSSRLRTPVMEGAGDMRTAQQLMGIQNEVRDKLLGPMSNQFGHIAKKGMMLRAMMDRAMHGGDSTMATILFNIGVGKAMNDELSASAKLSNGTTLKVQFATDGDNDMHPAAAYDSKNDEIMLYLEGILFGDGMRYTPAEINSMSEEEVGKIVLDSIVNSWPDIWAIVADPIHSVPTTIMHELRHRHDNWNHPLLLKVNADGLKRANNIKRSIIEREQHKIPPLAAHAMYKNMQEGKPATEEKFNEEAEYMLQRLAASLGVIDSSPFIRNGSHSTIGILKNIMHGITADESAIIKYRPNMDYGMLMSDPDISDEEKSAITLVAARAMMSQTIGYLANLTEINARITQYLPKIAMLRAVDSQHLTNQECIDEVSNAFKYIKILTCIPQILADRLLPDDKAKVDNFNHVANKDIIKRLWLAVDAANHIKIDPADTCETRLGKMADYLDGNRESKRPNRPHNVTPPPAPRKASATYRGGYSRQ